MKTSKLGSRLLSLLLTLALCMTALPLQVLAEEVPEPFPAASEEGPAAPGDADENDPYAQELVEAGEAMPLVARGYSDQGIVNRITAQINAMTAPYPGYSSISDLDSKVGKGSLSQFDYSGSQCVTYAILRVKEKLFGKNVLFGPTIANGKSAASNFISYGYGVNGSYSGKRFTAINGQEFGIVAYTNDGGKHITSNSWVCFNSDSNLANSLEDGHILFVEEVAEVNGIRYVYYTEGGAGFKSWPVKKKTFDKFYDNGRGYMGTVVFYPSGGTPSPPHTEHVKGSYLWPEALHPHYNYFTCSVCGATFTDGTTTRLESCSQCQAEIGKTSAPAISIDGQNVTLSWTYSGSASNFDAYLVQAPYRWEDIKYHIHTTNTVCVFSDVAPGDYHAFIIARPNADSVQSDWTSFTVAQPHSHTWDGGYVSKEPTFTSYGERTRTCTVCGETRMESIPMLDSVTAQYSDNIRMTYHRNGLLEIEGTGELTVPENLGGFIQFFHKDFQMADYSDQVTSVRFGEGITSIKGRVFGKMTNLESIDLPNSLTYLPNGLFDFQYAKGHPKLKSVYIPANVTKMGVASIDGPFGGSPFYDCDGLTSITVDPANPCFTSSDGVLFDKSMHTLLVVPEGKKGAYTIPNSVTKINASAFHECNNLTNVIIPDSVTEIGQSAFYRCTGLSSVIIPDSVTKLGDNIFWVSGLEEITLPSGLTKIPDLMFRDCYKLTSIVIPDSVTEIGEWAFSGCEKLVDISLPNGLTKIPPYAFRKCYNLANISIPDSVTIIGNDAFSDCYSLTNVSIPASVELIDHHAFYGCSSLTSMSIPGSVTSIGEYAFRSCGALRDVYFGGTAEQWAAITVESGNEPLQSAAIHYTNTPIPPSGNTMGPNNELNWARNGQTITVTGPVSTTQPLWVASYDSGGRLLSVSRITASGGSASLSAGAASHKLIWLDGNRVPKCGAVTP